MLRFLTLCFTLSTGLISQVLAGDRIKVELESHNLNETRPVLIRLPADYDQHPTKDYPTLYVLNEGDNFEWASYIVDLQASRFGIEDMLVVGLPHIGNYSGDNYPFQNRESLEPSPRAQKYSSFIREEVIPYIEKKYRVNGGRFIVGHSLSGLFVTHLFTQYPDAFSTYIVLSPSLHQAPHMADVMKNFLETSPHTPSQIYMSLGRLEHEQIQQGYAQMRDVFETTAPDALNYQINYMDHTDHLLAAFHGTYTALAWLYADYSVQSERAQKFSYEDYIRHYEALSKRLNYAIKPRERQLTGFAHYMAKRIGNVEAGVEALKAAEYYYPDSGTIKQLKVDLEAMLSEPNSTK